MSNEIITAINKLANQTGKMEGKFDGLERYIRGKTDICQRNYESLSNDMNSITSKVDGVVIEKEVSGKFKKILYNRITLLCTVIGLAIGFATLQNSSNNETDKKLVKISKELKRIKIANVNKIKEIYGKRK